MIRLTIVIGVSLPLLACIGQGDHVQPPCDDGERLELPDRVLADATVGIEYDEVVIGDHYSSLEQLGLHRLPPGPRAGRV